MNQKITLLILCTILFAHCHSQKEDSPYPRQVGDISFNPQLDHPDFLVCNEKTVQQYYAFSISSYKEEKPAIIAYFNEKYTPSGLEQENGYLTIRFIVNCQGESGRFRVQEMGLDYKKKAFNPELSDQLLQLTKDLDGWNNMIHNKQPYDYYQYLTFKIVGGNIQEILP